MKKVMFLQYTEISKKSDIKGISYTFRLPDWYYSEASVVPEFWTKLRFWV